MKHIWNRNKGLKIVLGISLLLLFLTLFFWGLAAHRAFIRLNEESWRIVASLYGELKEQYPDFQEEEWIRSLNRPGDAQTGERFLSQYGIFPQDVLSAVQMREQRKLFWEGMAVLALLGAGGVAVWMGYLAVRRKRIGELIAYIQRIQQGDYALWPKENNEDDLSDLKNELYKVTVLLKESAELSGRQKKALADSVSDISHQLKTPLTSVMVLLDNLSEDEQMEEATRRKFLNEVIRQLENMNWLIAALLKLSRLDAGVVEFERQDVDLDRLLEEVKEQLELQAEWKGIEIVPEGMRGIHFQGDPRWIREAVTNIVKNAIEHSPENSRVLLVTQENAIYSSLAVKDFGEGIPRSEQKEIFKRFFRGDYQRSGVSKYGKEGSTGIGLSLAKEIMERQGGSLSVASGEGEGTEFLFKFFKNAENVTKMSSSEDILSL